MPAEVVVMDEDGDVGEGAVILDDVGEVGSGFVSAVEGGGEGFFGGCIIGVDDVDYGLPTEGCQYSKHRIRC